MTNIVLSIIGVVCLVFYILRRKARIAAEEGDNY
jgi:hypothetical protein